MIHEEAYRACVKAVVNHEVDQHSNPLSTLQLDDIQRYVGIALDEYQRLVGESVRGDMHHMINPAIGRLRLLQREFATRDEPYTSEELEARAENLQHYVDRLHVALAAMDVSLGFEVYHDEVREMRRQFGMGLP